MLKTHLLPRRVVSEDEFVEIARKFDLDDDRILELLIETVDFGRYVQVGEQMLTTGAIGGKSCSPSQEFGNTVTLESLIREGLSGGSLAFGLGGRGGPVLYGTGGGRRVFRSPPPS